jgi:predicted TIM-barrel fold metal-dependent hydrolase
MIIDFHTHIFPPRFRENRDVYIKRDPLFELLYSNPKAKLATADDLITSMDDHNIDISVILNINWASPDLCHETNDYILESTARYPDRLIGFCMVVPDSHDTALKELELCIRNGIKGVGEIRPPRELLNNIALIDHVIKYIEKNNLILLTHASEPIGHLYPGKGDATPEALYALINHFSDLKLVCAHWGGGLPFYALMPEVKSSFENVFFDSAASPYLYNSRVYDQVMQLVGPEKVLFGTDYPLLSPKRFLNEIESLRFSEEVKNRLFFENARSLLEIEL